jgi:hypothetical protein
LANDTEAAGRVAFLLRLGGVDLADEEGASRKENDDAILDNGHELAYSIRDLSRFEVLLLMRTGNTPDVPDVNS